MMEAVLLPATAYDHKVVVTLRRIKAAIRKQQFMFNVPDGTPIPADKNSLMLYAVNTATGQPFHMISIVCVIF